MKINAEFSGFPKVSNIVGNKKLGLDISGYTVKDVIDELIKRYGKEMRDAFYDIQGNFHLIIQIVVNGKSFVPADKHETSLLKEGDSLIFMILFDGG